jgi:hypothetical protein
MGVKAVLRIAYINQKLIARLGIPVLEAELSFFK